MTKNPIIFKSPYSMFGVEVIDDPYADMIGMDAYGNYYQRGITEWFRIYEWNLAEKGIHDGWTEEIDEGWGKQYLVFRHGFFYLASYWNNAEHYGFKWRPWTYTEFKRVYHLLFKKHYKEGEVSFPALEDYLKNMDSEESN